MCGLFGFSGKGRSRPDQDILRDIAVNARRRGTDAFGVVWLNRSTGEHSSYKTVREDHGSIQQGLDLADSNDLIIGHARLATCGDPKSLLEAHPFQRENVSLAHNGWVMGHRERAQELGLKLTTGCDSELLAAAASQCKGDFHERAQAAVNAALPYPFAMLMMVDDRAFAFRSRNPLVALENEEGVYLCSTPWARGQKFTTHGRAPAGGFVELAPFTLYEITDGKLVKIATLEEKLVPMQSW